MYISYKNYINIIRIFKKVRQLCKVGFFNQAFSQVESFFFTLDIVYRADG